MMWMKGKPWRVVHWAVIFIAAVSGAMAHGQAPDTTDRPNTPEKIQIQSLASSDALRDAPKEVPLRVKSKVAGMDGLANERGDLLEYIITLPKGMNVDKSWDLVVVFVDTDTPASWQLEHLPAKVFGEDVIVVAMGPVRMSAEGAMVHQPGPRDSVVARDVILEITRNVPAGRVFLVGHGAGGSYALGTAAAFPRLIAGAVCIDSGMWEGTPTPPLSRMAVALVDQRGGYGRPGTWSLNALGVLREAEHRAAMVFWSSSDKSQVLDARRVGQASRFVRGMAAGEVADVMRLARELMSGDEPAFGAARLLLKRFEAFVPAEGMSDEEMQRAKINRYPREVKDPTDAQRAEAKAMVDAIEAHGLRHVAKLRELAKRWPVRTQEGDDSSAKQPLLRLEVDAPSAAWLGHVLAVQHRFAGVEGVEAYLKEVDLLGWQAGLMEQAEQINALTRVRRAMEEDLDLAGAGVAMNATAGEAMVAVILQWLDGGAASSDAPTDLAKMMQDLGDKEPTLKEAKDWGAMIERAKVRDRAIQQGMQSAADIDTQFVMPGK